MGKNTVKIDKKAIRISILNQLEIDYPNFANLKRKEKREIIRAACKAAEKALKSGEIDVPTLTDEERIGLGTIPSNIIGLDKMAKFIEDHQYTVIPFTNPSRSKYIRDPLLKFMDELLDDRIIDRLLATDGMQPAKRDWMPSRLLRIELLRSAKFPKLSVREFCETLADLERKKERAFCNLPLREKKMCDHSTLSTFRSSLTYEMRVNLMVYVAHHFLNSGRLGEDVIYAVDSTDVATPINSYPLGKIEVSNGKFIRFYSDLDCDCGSRRNKRDKSKMFVGYRVHTLCVTDVKSGIAFPLLSLAVAANHHDSQVFAPLLTLARAMGIEFKVLSADEAYADAEEQERQRKEHDTIVVTPPKSKVDKPEDVNPNNGTVFCDGACETPMHWGGYDKDDGGHAFVCNDDGSCLRKPLCSGERIIPIDSGLFGPVPRCIEVSQKVVDIRKVAERPFNLLKHMDGLEPCRMETHETVSAQVVFSQMVGIFKAMAGLRSVPQQKEEPKQLELPLAANE